ncbi:MAG: SdrD B-like domain-containing protein, partial [Puniceicoccales bacterium]
GPGEELTDSDTTTVVEPELEVLKTTDDGDGYVAAGQFVTYNLTVRHVSGVSTADAYGVVLSDTLPGDLENWVLLGATLDGVDVSSLFTLDTISGILTSTTPFDLAQGQELVVELGGNVILGIAEGTLIENDADVVWSSLPGGISGDDSGISNGSNDERTGSGGLNDYENDDNVLLEVGTGSIGDRVWWDVDADGRQDSGELGLPGQEVNLWRDDNANGILDAGDFFITSTLTDVNGNYLFEGLPTEYDDGMGGVTEIHYLVEVVPSAGLIQTYDLDGAKLSPNTATVVLDDGNEHRVDLDFGYRGSASVGDVVWQDRNSNGVKDAGEVGIPGVTVELTFSGGSAFGGKNMTLTTQTDENGVYRFDNLIGGQYTVTMDPDSVPRGMFMTYDRGGDLDGVESFSLGATQNRMDMDFGLAYPVPSSSSTPTGSVDFQYNVFHNFAVDGFYTTFGEEDGRFLLATRIDDSGKPMVTLAPIYSGEATPGSTIVITLFNSDGIAIATQSVVVDTGGNWMASLPGSIIEDYPETIQIVQTAPSHQNSEAYGYNLRPYYASALSSGHFFQEERTIPRVMAERAEVVSDSLLQMLESPFQFGTNGKHFYEYLTQPGQPSGR